MQRGIQGPYKKLFSHFVPSDKRLSDFRTLFNDES
jgi:hypothetical protein